MNERSRCAIYTRKSTEEGLEQDFNSLHAQREACEAFIKSQHHEGWRALPEAFDDGGYSGGTMERPALARLLEAVHDAQIDVVVVYKVDRLTRSLADFAKMVELFDAKSVSFVSVTQQFNTTTSMGRLTLNVLLSFAQFEREVTGERIRDKIAASKKKGLWMGGLVPLGYSRQDRKLVVNAAEAEIVRALFRWYLEVRTVKRLKEEADRQRLVTKRRQQASGCFTGGVPFTRGHLYALLSNPLYIGEVRHKGNRYSGQHEPVIDRNTFDAVQRQLAEHAVSRRNDINSKVPSLLTGLVCDETGDRLCPTYASKGNRRYRYYISKRLMHAGGSTDGGWRLPAKQLELTVLQAIQEFTRDELRVVDVLDLEDCPPEHQRSIIQRSAAIGDELAGEMYDRQRELLTCLVNCVALSPYKICVSIKRSGLASLLGIARDAGGKACEGTVNIIVPIQLKRRGVETKLIMMASREKSAQLDENLLTLLGDAHRWMDDLVQGRAVSVRDIARQYEKDPGEVSRTLPLVFLAPDIVKAILEGSQPVELTPRQLKRIGVLPFHWDDQRRRLGLGD